MKRKPEFTFTIMRVEKMITLRDEHNIELTDVDKFNDKEVLDFIYNLNLINLPVNEPMTHWGSVGELEQYLGKHFPKYTYTFKWKTKPEYGVYSDYLQGALSAVYEDYFYIAGCGDIGIKQTNTFVLCITEAKCLINIVKGEHKYLVLKFVEENNKFKLVEKPTFY